MIKFVLMDLDDTILNFSLAEQKALARTFEELGISVTEENVALYSRINSSVWSKIEKGELTRSEALIQRFALLFAHVGVQADPHKTNDFYFATLSQNADFIAGAKELLEELKGKYSLIAVSNGNSVVQWPRIKKAHLEDYFDKIFISQEVGFDKPSEKFFIKCFEQIENFNRDEAIILGDRLSSDVLGGQNARIKTCWFNEKGEVATNIKPDFEIHSLSEFMGVLEQL
ncbi:MAG: YjjG family noncanonical pyrimidine nucleotidase [Clostridia bacterium]|nr:YjjG family noncanonical pyrimidine nucleotidase [Clostridia bacterium]